MSNKLLGVLLSVQLAVIVYYSLQEKSQPIPVAIKAKPVAVEKEITVEQPLLAEQPLEVEELKVKPPVDEFNFVIPRRRVITREGGGKLLTIDKVNVMGTLGETFMENPIIQLGIEKRIRRQLFEFYGDFIRQADLTPQEQQDLFRILSSTTQENVKSMMRAMGENMGDMADIRENGFSTQLMQGMKENNLAMKEELISSFGDENFNLFEQYHIQKSAEERYDRLERRLERDEVPLDEEQKEDMQELILENQRSPFDEETYSQELNKKVLNKNADSLLNEQQLESLQNSRRHGLSRVLLLPW